MSVIKKLWTEAFKTLNRLRNMKHTAEVWATLGTKLHQIVIDVLDTQQ